MTFDGRYKTIIYHGLGFGEIYDLENDPGEFNDLWDDPKELEDDQKSEFQDHVKLKNILVHTYGKAVKKVSL